MALPVFSDIGKLSKDLFEKNFHFGLVNLSIKNDLNGQLYCEGTQKFTFEDGKVNGEVEGKYIGYGMTMKPKVTTDGVISADIKLEKKVNGIDFTGSGSFTPKDKKYNTAFGFIYRTADYNLECSTIFNDPKLKANGTIFQTNGVANLFGWIFGASILSDFHDRKIMKTQFVGGYQDPRFSFFVQCDPQSHQLSGSVFNLVNSNIQTGIVYNMGQVKDGEKGSQPNLAFCASYILNAGATIKARINTEYQLGVSYILQVKEGINLTLCSEVDVHKLKQGGHKVGLGIEFN